MSVYKLLPLGYVCVQAPTSRICLCKLLPPWYVCVQAPTSRICLCTSSYLWDMSVYKLLPLGYVCVQAPAGQVDRQSSGAACLPSVPAPASSAARAMMAMSKQENSQSVKQYGTLQESRKARILLSRRKRCHEGIQLKLPPQFQTSVADPDPHWFCRLDPDPEGQKCPKKIDKGEEISCFEVLDVLF